jgi:pseudaminic acid cytidylyltransferase
MSSKPDCLIPARGGSKRFPRKNVALLAGKPLLGWTVEAAVESEVFRRVVVSSEDAEIAALAVQYGAQHLQRSAELASDSATVMQVTLDYVATCDREGRRLETICVMLPTAAMVYPGDLRAAFALLDSDTDVVMAVTRFHEPPFWALHDVEGFLKPVWPDLMKRSQELPKAWVDCGYFYFARVDALARERSFYATRLKGHPLPRIRSVDIDVPEDLQIAEALFALDVESRASGGASQ